MQAVFQGATDAHPDGSSWSLEWVAPSGNAPVIFHVSANSGNGDNSPLSDLIYTFEATVTAASNPGGP